jgi:DNA polymerase-3 subunit epsilon
VVDRFQSLMNPGIRIPAFITQLTGITNAMVQTAPPVAQVMRDAARFVGNCPMVAHNASFDRKLLAGRAGPRWAMPPRPRPMRRLPAPLLLARRLVPAGA